MDRSDAEAISASEADPEAFAAIFDRHATDVHRFLVRRVEPAEAESLLGEVFRIAFERRTTFDLTRDSARPWLYGIATNLVAHHRRSEGRRLRAVAVLAARLPRAADGVGDRAAEAADARDALSRLAEAVDALPEGERAALMLYAWEDQGYEDIAAALDIPVGTVRSRLSRARRRLRATRDDASDDRPSTPRGRLGRRHILEDDQP